MSIRKFIQLKPDEKIIAIYRQYGFTYIWSVLLAFVLLVLPFFLLAWFFSHGLFGVLGFFVLLGFGLWYSLRKIVHWYYNLFVVTDRRIVDVDQRGFFDRTVSEVAYGKIQDVSYRIKGILPTVLHFGTVVVQTAGSTANLELERMKNPEQIVDLINEFREHEDAPRDKKMEMVAKYVEGLSEDELRVLVQEASKRVREEAMNDFFKPSQK